MNEIIFEIKEKIGILKFNLPETRNAISRALLKETQNTIHNLSSPEIFKEVRCLILTSSHSQAFSSGADLKERACMSQDEVWGFLDEFRKFLLDLESLPIPTIAGIEGVALGGGLEIALACDLRVCSNEVSLGLPETKLGIIPGAGGTQRLPRLIGESKAKDLIFTGRRLDAEEAFQLGLINRIFPKQSFQEETFLLAKTISESAPISIYMAKEAIQKGHSMELEKGLDLERNCYKSTIHTKDRLEALNAFKEKRKPHFIGE